MLSMRLQLPQSLTRQGQRQRQWQSPWQPHPGFQSRSVSQSQPLPATPRKTANSWKPKREGEPESRPFRRIRLSSNNKASNLGSNHRPRPGKSISGIVGGRSESPLSKEVLKTLENETSVSKAKSQSSDILSEFSSWIDGSPTAQAVPNEKDTGSDARVLFLQSASRFLVESDFYRLASEGRHVDGWVQGLSRVIQARSPVTQQPQGKYFLFFDKPASAQAYLQKVLDLHAKLRKLAAKDLEGNSQDVKDSQINQELAKAELPTLLRTYTLLPPGASLKMQINSEAKVLDLLRKEDKQVRRKRGDKSPSRDEPTQEAWNAIFDHDNQVDELDLRTEQNRVLLKLSRSKLTVYGLRWAIDVDSKRRNLPWRLQVPSSPSSSSSGASSSSSSSPIQPLEYSKRMVKFSLFNQSSPQGGEGNEKLDEDANSGSETKPPAAEEEDDTYNDWKYPDQSWGEEGAMWSSEKVSSPAEWENRGAPGKIDARHEGFGSFVVSFADVHEARRFAREWHKRRVWDYRTGRWITVDTTWLW